MRIIFLGPPGVGKGTQSQKLVEFLNIPHISTGEMLREAIRNKTELGLKVAAQMEGGRLAADEIVVQLVRQRLAQPDCRNGYLLDGFPRTLPQAASLDLGLAVDDEAVDAVLNLTVDQDELLSRLMARAQKEDRGDDNEETIRNRMKVYDDMTSPLIAYYEEQQVLHRIDGIGSIDEVFDRIKTILEEVDRKRNA
ncbi:adenylate kinase [Blastopirellula marina]|uniref:Adenylate kinase n=1 Tax=Blastopirellula marina TaxID=124 RepID=A0A2S8FTX8_9BACT|nr:MULTISPECIES: adenylate kinase [Pirellulaceae]PQO35638.1 adenylate kinase [Blastopirellula marina]RCS53212.1 adenylate kinase [Bremerella cremea]